MDRHPLVVLANEPAAYRSLLASELPFLRPDLRVMEIDPAELDATVETLHPAVVVCSRSYAHIRDTEVAIVLLGAGEVDSFIHSGDEAIVNPRLSDILGAIDRAVSSTHTSPSHPSNWWGRSVAEERPAIDRTALTR